ncbi:MAG: copper resistance protein CopC [Nitrospirae bacterium]|nr:copper resistance protein CopC [Nitrospirota bacterium]
MKDDAWGKKKGADIPPGRTFRRADPGTIAAVLFFAFLCALPALSFGHAFPDHSDPRVGATVNSAPAQVRVWFDSALEPAFSTIMVHNAGNIMVDKRDSRVDPSDPTLLVVSLPPLPAGTYRVIWNVVARDGHRTTGDFTFTIK